MVTVYCQARRRITSYHVYQALCPALAATDNRHVPRAPLPLRGVTSTRTVFHHRLGRCYPTLFAHTGSCARPKTSETLCLSARSHSLRRWLRAPAGSRPFPALSPRIFPQMLEPLPRRSAWCTCSLLPMRHRPSPSYQRIGTPQLPVQRLQYGSNFRGCSYSLMFGPPGLLTTPVAPTAMHFLIGQPWFLHPSISWFVTSPRIGYASRANRAIDGMGTLTPLDSRPCWPLR